MIQLLLLLGGIIAAVIVGNLILEMFAAVTERNRPTPPTLTKPSSWQGSAEQRQLHVNDEINEWKSGSPY